MGKSLPPTVQARIEQEGRAGREAWKSGDLALAEQHFLNGWNALPEARLDYDFAQLLSSGITTFYRNTHQFDKAWEWMEIMRKAYGPEPDPYAEFLAGTIAFESGNLAESFRLFRPLYETYGARLFQEQDPKYLELARQRKETG